jgi:predicted nucleic acid-binding Zn ribbon protein
MITLELNTQTLQALRLLDDYRNAFGGPTITLILSEENAQTLLATLQETGQLTQVQDHLQAALTASQPPPQPCPVCGRPLTGKQTYCSDRCKQQAYRARRLERKRQHFTTVHR